MVGEGHAPVVAVLLAAAKKTKGIRPHCCPQRAWTPDPAGVFPCKLSTLAGSTKGGHERFMDPLGGAPLQRGSRVSRARTRGHGHAPVVPVLLVPARTTWAAESGN